MNKTLENIVGIKLPTLPFTLRKVGDLIYFGGSLMAVYEDTENNPYIFDWVESNNQLNRWLVYRTDIELLSNYIYLKETHFNLINNPFNGVLFIVDKDKSNSIVNCQIIPPNKIPNKYLPKSNLRFEEEDSVNLEKIISTFELKQNELKVELKSFDILEEARKNNSELVNIHVKSKDSSKVGYGKIRSSILGAILLSYHNLAEATAVNLFDEKGKLSDDKKVRHRKGEIRSIKELGETEFVYAKAASFSIFLKPLRSNAGLFNKETSSESIAKSIFKLFQASEDIKELELIKDSLSNQILNSYNQFLKEIKEQDILVSIQYGNPNNKTELLRTFDSLKANKILQNLDVLEIDDTIESKIKGNFIALDSKSFTFKFQDVNGEIYEGKFSELLKPGIYLFNLKDLFQVTIETQKIRSTGKKDIIDKNIIVSCVQIVD